MEDSVFENQVKQKKNETRARKRERENEGESPTVYRPEGFPKRRPVTHREIPMFSLYSLSCGPLTICISRPRGFLAVSPAIRLF